MFIFKTRDYEKYREWEVQGVSIEGLIFCKFDEMKTHGQKLKNKTVQNKGANGEEGGDQTFKIVREHPSGSNIFAVDKCNFKKWWKSETDRCQRSLCKSDDKTSEKNQ